MYQFCTTTHSINGETSSIAEHIQYRTSLSIMFQQRTVVTLIYEEAGFLTFKPVDMEFQSILHCDIIFTSPIHETIFFAQFVTEMKRRFALIIYITNSTVHNLHQSIAYLMAMQMYANGMSLNNSRLSITIYNQS